MVLSLMLVVLKLCIAVEDTAVAVATVLRSDGHGLGFIAERRFGRSDRIVVAIDVVLMLA